MTEKKTPNKKAAPSPTPHAMEPGAKVLGPGVVKRPKRDPATAPTGSEEIPYTPSELVFHRKR